MRSKNISIILLLVVSSFDTFAQYENLYAFFGVGKSYYQGDLNETAFPNSHILNTSYKGGIGYDFHTLFGAQIHYTQAQLNGNDYFNTSSGLNTRGLSFTSPLKEFGINFKLRNLNGKEGRLINYLYTGVNFFSFDPTVTKLETSGTNYIAEVGFKKSGINIPAGIGIGYWVTNNIGIVWETGMHILYTDYLDGVSQNGNPNYKDSFIDSHIMVLFRFGEWQGMRKGYQRKSKGFKMRKNRSIGCPKF
jgi:hypothetical protein